MTRSIQMPSEPARLRSTRGLTQVEVMTALLVLAMGLVSLTSASGWLIRSTQGVQGRTERLVALQSTVEELQALPFGELTDGSRSHAGYRVSWRVSAREVNSALVEVIAVGPVASSRATSAPTPSGPRADTLYYRASRQW